MREAPTKLRTFEQYEYATVLPPLAPLHLRRRPERPITRANHGQAWLPTHDLVPTSAAEQQPEARAELVAHVRWS